MNKFVLSNHLQRLLVFFILAFQVSFAGALDMKKDRPVGPVLLTISGKIGLKNSTGIAEFDDAMLSALPQKSIVTETPWNKGMTRYTGPLLSDVLNAVDASSGNLKAVALNDYKVNIPMEDLKKYGVIVARQIDGKRIAIRDKGPLFVMYPFDKFPEIKTTGYFSRCIWQLQSIVVE